MHFLFQTVVVVLFVGNKWFPQAALYHVSWNLRYSTPFRFWFNWLHSSFLTRQTSSVPALCRFGLCLLSIVPIKDGWLCYINPQGLELHSRVSHAKRLIAVALCCASACYRSTPPPLCDNPLSEWTFHRELTGWEEPWSYTNRVL